jgi:hypothetical protein
MSRYVCQLRPRLFQSVRARKTIFLAERPVKKRFDPSTSVRLI